jgi:hypothetical protein
MLTGWQLGSRFCAAPAKAFVDDSHWCSPVVVMSHPSISARFSVPYPVFSRFPGMAVGAAGASTVGENRLGSPGSMRGAFSVGSAGAPGAPGAGVAGGTLDSVVVVVVVVVVGDCVVDGAFEPLPLQLAIDAANPARIAAPAKTRARRTGSRFSIMTSPIDLA